MTDTEFFMALAAILAIVALLGIAEPIPAHWGGVAHSGFVGPEGRSRRRLATKSKHAYSRGDLWEFFQGCGEGRNGAPVMTR
ncbi:MAG: hypothetical protein OXG44_06025 [Gammaproteobacteria bacterium]|nr:hypothetical protein [Gammaproteobacteria bacterium]